MSDTDQNVSEETRGLDWLTLALVALAMIATDGQAADNPERYYQQQWCDARGGRLEVAQHDRTRVDCLTDSHAIEFDFGRKWAEAIGQSLGYASMTGMRPGIVLIIEKPAERRYWKKLQAVVDSACLNIRLWCTGAGCEVVK